MTHDTSSKPGIATIDRRDPLFLKLRDFIASEFDRTGIRMAAEDIAYLAERLPAVVDAARKG
jgi:hypothetical protein